MGGMTIAIGYSKGMRISKGFSIYTKWGLKKQPTSRDRFLENERSETERPYLPGEQPKESLMLILEIIEESR